MQLLNATKMKAGYTLGMQPDGRELLVVVVKGTFAMPRGDQEPVLAEKQAPLVEADVFTGEPGLSAPLYESDYAPRKPRCDVLLNGSAYAPGGRPAERVTVSLRVGSLSKSFVVVGKRTWQPGLLHFSPSRPEPFTVLPISYNNAFGGVDRTAEDPSKHRWYPTNHAGVGYSEHQSMKAMEGQPVPNTEEPGHAITNPNAKYRPMAFGPVGRAWQPRPTFAGTYDQKWLDNAFPFLPSDFKEEYYQAAPADQQMAYPQGGEEVELVNLTPAGRSVFKLAKFDLPIEFTLRDRQRKEVRAVLDTIVMEPDLGRFSMVWRTSLSLRRNIFEVTQVAAGKMSPGWYRARATGKTYCRSLQEMCMAKGFPGWNVVRPT
jgi:hypothetical protein